MSERKFTQGLHKKGNAAKIRENVSLAMRQSIVSCKPKSVEPIDYETFVVKNKVLLHNDPQREMLTFPHDDVEVPSPSKKKKIRTTCSTVPKNADKEASNLLVRECIKTYNSDCHLIRYKYGDYSGSYQHLPRLKKHGPLPEHVFEIDDETVDNDEEPLNRSFQCGINKSGWLYKGPDSGKDNIISFTRQFKKRFFCLKQQSDFTYILEFYKDEKKTDAKGAIFLDLAIEVARNPKKGKYCFEVRMHEKGPYLLAAENEHEAADWTQTLNKIINAAETASNLSLERKDESYSPRPETKNPENSMHPELVKYSRETETSLIKARQESRHNVFSVYPDMSMSLGAEDSDSEEESEIDVFPKQYGARYMLRMQEFKTRLQVNLAEEGHSGHKHTNPEPFFITFALYDAKECRKISEDFHVDCNDPDIISMIPSEFLKAPGKSHSQDGIDTQPDVLEDITSEWLNSKQRQAIFSVLHCHSEVYLHAKIEKVLQGGISQCTDPYIKTADGKSALKVHRQMKQFCSHIGHCRMPFGWSARPLLQSGYGPSDLPIYKQESGKLSEDEIIKHLQDFKKPDKQAKLQIIPGTFKIFMQPLSLEDLPENTVTSAFVPLSPFPVPAASNPTLELEEFLPEKGQFSTPYDHYLNQLYVYPLNLKYDSQKSFTKARNISCTVEIRDSDDDSAVPLKCIYGKPYISVYTTVANCPILHHSNTPEFTEEVKIALPTQLHEKHHLLFRFHHVSCESSKSSSIRNSTGGVKKKDNIETPVGYAWLQLLQSGRVAVGEQGVSVSATLPHGYLGHELLGMGKGNVPDIKYVDGGKPLFKVNLRLMSTIYTKDNHLNNFFLHCEKMDSGSLGLNTDSVNKLKAAGFSKHHLLLNSVKLTLDLNKLIKSLHAVDVSTFVQFLPTLFNQLFKLLTKTISDDVAANAVRVLIHIVSAVHEANKSETLEKYVKYIFRTDHVARNSKQKTVHEELAKNLTVILRPANVDPLVLKGLLDQSWFFFEILIKSMTLYLIDTERIKMPRNERFSSDFQFRIQNLLQMLIPHILQKSKELPIATRNANHSLAAFVKNSFTLMDRGFVFKIIASYMDGFNPGDDKLLQEFKFEFLRLVCSHEHYVPLSLPLMRKGLIKTFQDIKPEDLKNDYSLSDEYRKNHYLTGLLLQELQLALNERREIRRQAITVLRNQLAKHSFDDRYSTKSQQGRIAALYLPIISILLENRDKLSDSSQSPSHTAAVPNGDAHSVKDGPPKTPTSQHKSLVNLEQAKRDSAVFLAIAGTGTIPSVPQSNGKLQIVNGSAQSLNKSSSNEMIEKETSLKEKADDKSHKRSPSHAGTTTTSKAYMNRYNKLEHSEIRDLLVCFIYVLKNLPEDLLKGWFNNSSEFDIVDFFSLLELSQHHFRYLGKRRIFTLSVIGDTRKALTMPSQSRKSVTSELYQQKTLSQYSDVVDSSGHVPSSSEADTMFRALMEANIATEVGLVTLDILSLYCDTFKGNLAHRDGENGLMRKVFDLYLSFLKTSQSETLQKHIFASWRSFIRKFPSVLFRGNALLCGELCYEILRCCNSKLGSTRKEACALLYLLMRSNFEYSKKTSFTRVHLQVIISVSQLIGDVVGLSNSRFQESLAIINNYANSDKAMQKSSFPSEVKDLTKRIRTVLMATAQMREHEKDPEMLVDLQYSLAKSYATTPELRKTWLDSMAKIHNRNGDYSEAAHCYIHIAALIAEYLKKRGKMKHRAYPNGCSSFGVISENITKEEAGLKDDSGMHDVQYSEETLVEVLELAAKYLEKSERYEMMGEVYKIIIPVMEKMRDFEKLSETYQILSDAYSKVVEVTQSGRRLLGKYYRVSFFGQAHFEEEDGKEYIYKEPKVTSLTEICERLRTMYCDKFGRESVQLIKDSNKVNVEDLDPKYAYIQVTYVTPYFDDKELDNRITDFERNNNIRRFMYETPFTKAGKSRGSIEEQYKRRTILVTTHRFPYVKKRIEICDKKDSVLKPIEVAIDEMQNRVQDLREIINMSIPDMKKLQLKLQGCVSAQVHAGPLAYAEAFLSDEKAVNNPSEKIEALKTVFSDFVSVCNDALELNGTLISTEQKEYHESMKNGFKSLVDKLSDMLGEKILTSVDSSLASQRNSMTLFNVISATSTTSTA